MLLPLPAPNVRTSAATTASINVRRPGDYHMKVNQLQHYTNSSTNATTTASTNSSTNATTTESTKTLVPREDANKDGNAEDNRFHPVTDINKESYKRKGVKWFLARERN
ncbi:CFF_collapsed_G0059080.mRNA.1.CDS.1 [Saccharomyces cerevisiae]|nr:CFF_collapsed_G0059080.mRNA.1.CDS.1 [Saccharomyces cerevisiae]